MLPSQALELLRSQPLDITPAIVALQHAADLDDPALPALCARIAAALPSRQAFEDLMGDRASLMANFYPEKEKATPSTVSAIDTFLSTFGVQEDREMQMLEKMIFSSTPDYAATFAAENQDTPLPQATTEQDKLIDSFLQTQSRKQVAEYEKKDNPAHEAVTPAPTAPKHVEQSSLTESFVRVLVKNGNYTKALEIISEINLKNPEKSIYFADQMRFLKKLIINANKK